MQFIPHVLVLIAACVVASVAIHAQAPLPIRCADLSFEDEVVASGGQFGDGSDGALPLLADAGLNTVRLRLWHTPEPGRDDLADVLAAAARAEARGLDVLLALHYSDSWADPGKQTKPSAWAGLSPELLADSVYAYTRAVLTALRDQGTPPRYVQLGNEITVGMLWDTGRVGGAFDTPTQWAQLARLLAEGRAAVRDALDDDVTVVLHIDRGADLAGATWFFDRLRPLFDDFDVIGLSYYPWWHGDLDAFTATLDGLAERYGRPLFIAETGYPWSLGFFDDTNNLVGLPDQVLPGFPATPAGQADFLAAVTNTVAAVPDGLGVCYWAPDWIAAPRLGSAWENVALFDDEGQLLPAASVLGGTAVASEPPAPPARPLRLTVYPNPTVDVVTLDLDGPSGCGTVDVVDLLGRTQRVGEPLCSGTPLRLRLGDEHAGMVALRVRVGAQQRTRTLVVTPR
ncbi:MAG: glycosyl hydrolase 53 family protein [Bacteroidota bacterium]